MLARIFWSGAAVPRSKSATMDCVVLHLVARSFCVILGSIFWRCSEMTAPTSLPIVVGLTMSSERSTLVRCWPSTPGLEACEALAGCDDAEVAMDSDDEVGGGIGRRG